MRKLYYSFVDRWIFQTFHHLLGSAIKKNQYLVNGKVLDIGCGKKPYQKLFKNVDTMIGTNSEDYYSNLDKLPSDTDVICNDGTKLPFENESFDSVLNFQVLPVFKDMHEFFKEINRVLKPKGYLFLSSDFLYPIWNAPDNYWRTTEYGLKLLAEQNGFTSIKAVPLGGYYAMQARLKKRFIRTKMAWVISKTRQSKGFVKIGYLLLSLVILLRALLAPIWLNVLIYILLSLDKLEYDSDFTTGYLLIAQKKC